MKRRQFVTLLGSSLAWPLASTSIALAQKQDKIWRVGFLDASLEATRRPLFDAFRRRMSEIGYTEGLIAYYTRFAEGHFDRLPDLARELIASGPDVLFVATTPAAVAAKAATRDVPIVIVAVADPIGVGLVQSLARPGGNVTGITNIAAELTGKRLEILKELLPAASRVAVLVNPGDPVARVQLQNGEAAARNLGIELRPIAEVRGPEDLEGAFATAIREGAEAAIRMVDPLSTALAKETAEAAAKHRLPVIYPFRQNVVAGGLVAYGTDLPGQFVQAADLVDKVLKGANPAELPLQQPTKVELIINLKTAKALGLTLPQSMLMRADEVIE